MSDLGRCSFKGAQEWTNCRCPKSPRLWKYKLLCNDGWRTFSSNCVISWDAIGHFFRITVDKGIDPLKSASLECVCVSKNCAYPPIYGQLTRKSKAQWMVSGFFPEHFQVISAMRGGSSTQDAAFPPFFRCQRTAKPDRLSNIDGLSHCQEKIWQSQAGDRLYQPFMAKNICKYWGWLI